MPVGLAMLLIIPALLGNIAFPLLTNYYDASYSIDRNAVMLIAAFVLIVAVIVLSNINDGGKRNFLPNGLAAEEGTTAVNLVCEELAVEHHLTARELDVLNLLAVGNNQKRASELLGIAPTTVQTHAKSLYRKLSVHNRQELIDTVRSRLAGK